MGWQDSFQPDDATVEQPSASGWQSSFQPDEPTASAQSMNQSFPQQLHHFFEDDPAYKYPPTSPILPIKKNISTGKTEAALPPIVRSIGRGVADLMGGLDPGASATQIANRTPESLDALGALTALSPSSAASHLSNVDEALMPLRLPGFKARSAEEMGGERLRLPSGVAPSEKQQVAVGNKILNSADNPEYVKTMLGLNPDNIPAVPFVPRSKPTTAQSLVQPDVEGNIGDVGIAGLEQGVQAKNTGAFNQQRIDQLRAQNQMLTQAAPEADQTAVGTHFVNILNGIRNNSDTAVNQAQGTLRGSVAALGQPQSFEEIGNKIRDRQIAPTLREDDRAEAALWNTVREHYGDNIDGSPVVAAHNSIMQEMNFGKGGERLKSYEQPVFDAAGQWDGRTETFEDARKLGKTIQQSIREARSNGDAEAVRRLTIMQGATDSALENNINNIDAAYRNNADRFQQQTDQSQHNFSQLSPEFRATYGIDQAHPAEPMPLYNPVYGSAGQEAYSAARLHTMEQRQFYGQPVMADILAPGKNGQQYRMQDANIPNKIFNSQPTSPENIRTYLSERGGGDAQTLHDIAFAKMRDRGAIGDDGMINQAKLDAFVQSHRAAIDATPGLSDKLQNIQASQDAYNTRMAQRETAVSDFNNTQAARFIGSDPKQAVASAFSGNDAPQKLILLANDVAGNPAAEAGLRDLVRQHIIEQVRKVQNGDTTGLDLAGPKAFRTFMAKNGAALNRILGAEGMTALNAVLTDMRRVAINDQATKLVGRSDTAPAAAMMGKSLFNVFSRGLAEHASAAFGAGSGLSIFGPVGGIIGAALGAGADKVMNAMAQRNIHTMDQLLLEAMRNPELARLLVQKASTTKPGTGEKIARALIKNTPSRTTAKASAKRLIVPLIVTVHPRKEDDEKNRTEKKSSGGKIPLWQKAMADYPWMKESR